MASRSFGILTRKSLGSLCPMKEDVPRRFYALSSHRRWENRRRGRRNFSGSDRDIVKSSYPELKIPDMPFHEFVFENLGNWENKIGLICAETEKKYTYKEVYKYSKCLAASLQRKFGLKKGDRLATILPNSPDFPLVYLAASIAGAVTTTINHTYTSVEISHQIKEVQPKVLFTTPEAFQKCQESSALIDLKAPIIVIQKLPNTPIPQGGISFIELLEACSPGDLSPVTIDPATDDLVLPFSSGTSGLPKGVQLTHQNIMANLIQYASGNEMKSNPDKETNQSIVLGVLPMFHIYGMVVVTFDSLREGARLVTLPKFEPKLFIETIHSHKIQILYLVPPLIFFMSSHPMVEPQHLKSVQHVVLGAAPCGASDIKNFLKKGKDIKISQGYGMTESSPVITMTHKDRFHKIASPGHPVASTCIKVAQINTGKPLPVGNRGEIWVKGPQVMKGYFNRPEETKNTFDVEGWLKTGDIGYYDEEFDFYIVDRMKELIKVKGYQVAPAELEEFLRKHPKLSDAGVIGVDHPELGQVPKAFVVLKPGVTATEAEIQDYIKDNLSSYKHLKGGVQFVKEIPKSAAGKILRKDLKKIS